MVFMNLCRRGFSQGGRIQNHFNNRRVHLTKNNFLPFCITHLTGHKGRLFQSGSPPTVISSSGGHKHVGAWHRGGSVYPCTPPLLLFSGRGNFCNQPFHSGRLLHRGEILSSILHPSLLGSQKKWTTWGANFNSVSKEKNGLPDEADARRRGDEPEWAHVGKSGEGDHNGVEELAEEREENEVTSEGCVNGDKTASRERPNGNYLQNAHSLLVTKKIKEALSNLRDKHSYRVISKKIKKEKNKINALLSIYHLKKGSLKQNLNEHIYRKAIMHTKTKIFQVLKKNNKRSIMDIYYEEKRKYKLRKEKLLELQEKLFTNSRLAKINVKKFFKKYGYIGFGTYFVVFVLTFSCSYLFVHFKYISLADLTYWSEKMHLTKYMNDDLQKKIDSVWGELIFAYIASKITEPVRIVITILITPYIAKVIRLKRSSRIKSF
ncbi:hypothetical protein AK88_00336 [Plasmodium fragile]|uniref:DUF1279 domain-containing protein n=1 Tax=Plasmodium fragile TaxID=5857 RepID=A0A0D9QS03_PLAFR|nr:uncharacterized protein AK88_00336 [Plasmodium fragile]KJP89880.1 hypothetical protein AK88_00336 [Plasmodium fragile]